MDGGPQGHTVQFSIFISNNAQTTGGQQESGEKGDHRTDPVHSPVYIK